MPALKPTALLAAILIVSPVAGLRPSLADLSEILNTPKPDTETFSPFTNSLVNKSKVALNTF